MDKLHPIISSTAFLMTYDGTKGIELFEPQDRWILKLLAKMMNETRGDYFYVRFQDDIILVSRKMHVLKRIRKEVFQILDVLRLSLRPEKTFMRRSQREFDLLGYTIAIQGFLPSQKTQERNLEVVKRRYAQGGYSSLQMYLNRWRTWVHAGLPLKVHYVENIISSIAGTVTTPTYCANSQRKSNRPPFSVLYGLNSIKGIRTCIKNFSEYQF